MVPLDRIMETCSQTQSNTETSSSSSLTLKSGSRTYEVQLTHTQISWKFKRKHPFVPEKEIGKWKCKTTVPINEIVAIEYKNLDVKQEESGDNIEMANLARTAFVLHYVKRVPNHVWQMKSIDFECKTVSECTNFVEEVKSLLSQYINRPRSLLVFINPFGGKKRAKKIFYEKVAPIFDVAGIISHVIVTERADHAQEYIVNHDLNRYDGIICVGGDGMFAELLNGLLRLHNNKMGVDLDDDRQKIRQPDIRLGVIPAGSTDTVVYCTCGASDPTTSALHIVIGDNMSVDVCSVRNGLSGKLIRFCVSMLGYGFYGDVLEDSEKYRWMGPSRYDWSGFKTFLKHKTYSATIDYLPSPALDERHHPGVTDGLKCYSGCHVCKSASLLDLNGSLLENSLSALELTESIHLEPVLKVVNNKLKNDNIDRPRHSNKKDEEAVLYDQAPPRSISHVLEADDNMSYQSSISRPYSSISKINPDSWVTAVGQFIGITALTISCRCETVPEGVSPSCHLGDGSSDLVLIRGTSRFDYLRHLIRIKRRNVSQFDFDFVDVQRVKAFRVRVHELPGGAQTSQSFHRLNDERPAARPADSEVSCWNCDGEIIREANIDVRVHCQLVNIFARGIENLPHNSCSSSCLLCNH